MVTYTTPTDLSTYQGTGSVTLPVFGSGYSTLTSSSGNGGGGVDTLGSAGVTVTYTYVPVIPEPMSAIVFATGGLGLLGWWLKK